MAKTLKLSGEMRIFSIEPEPRDLVKSGRLFNFSLTDEEAERAGNLLAEDFGLKKSRAHLDRWETGSGTFTARGIARRALRLISEGI